MAAKHRALVIQYLISLPDAIRMMKGLNAKKHSALGFNYELKELKSFGLLYFSGGIIDDVQLYKPYSSPTIAYHLKVFRKPRSGSKYS